MARSGIKLASCAALMAVAVMLMMISDAPKAQAALSCQSVGGYVSSCLSYLASGGAGYPSSACCTGVRNLNNAARTTPDRRIACGCLKSLSGNLPQSGIAAAAGIPGKCNVAVPYKIDPKTDCSKVY